MRNLKRVLSLVMAMALIVGMMVVSASAANYQDFTDKDEIKHTEAVQTMVALNVIAGQDTGAFDPTGSLTRAQMAKIITYVMNGGVEPVLGVKATPTYKDIDGHWAEKYIEYCTSMGIIAGVGSGYFDPEGTLTGSQAAKMLLTAMGYKAEVFGFVGNDWAINVSRYANEAGLYEDLGGMDPSVTITRDEACQLAYNAIQAPLMVRSWQMNQATGQVTETYNLAQTLDTTTNTMVTTNSLLMDKFDGVVAYGYMTDVDYDSDKAQFTYTFDDSASFNGPAITTAGYDSTLKTTIDAADLYGMKTKVIYKNDSNKTVYGIYAADSSVLVDGVVGKLPSTIAVDATSVKYDGTSYKLDKEAKDTPVYTYNGSQVGYLSSYKAAATNPYTFKFIDNDDNGKVNVVVVLPYTVAKVTFVGDTSVTAGNISYKFEDCNIYEGIAKDDYVVVTAAANTKYDTITLEKVEMVNGTVSAERTADGEYRVDDTWYTWSNVNLDTLTIKTGDEVSLAVVNGYIFGGKIVEGTALTDVIYVAASTGAAGSRIDKTLGEYKGVDTRIVMSDGTNKVVKALRVDVTSVSTGISASSDDTLRAVPGVGLYTYSVNKDGVYELKAIKATGSSMLFAAEGSNPAGYVFNEANLPSNTTLSASFGTANNTFDKDSAKVGTYFIADNAVFYLVQTSNGTSGGTYEAAKVVTGAQLKSMKDFGDNAQVMYKSVNGLSSAVVGVIYDDTKIAGTDVSTGYGYVVSDGYAEKNADGDWTVKFTVWNGEENADLTVTDVTAASDVNNAKYAKGSFVYYTVTATENEVTDVTQITGQAAITGYDGNKNIALDGNAYTFKDDSKSVVIFVDTANKAGVQGGTINLAQKMSTGNYVKNAVYKITTGEIDVLFVDTANKLAGATYTVATPSSWAGSVAGVTAIADNGTVASAKAGSNVDLKYTLTGTVSNTGKGATLTATVTLVDTTSFTVTQRLSDGATGAQIVEFNMPYQNIAAISFSIAANA